MFPNDVKTAEPAHISFDNSFLGRFMNPQNKKILNETNVNI